MLRRERARFNVRTVDGSKFIALPRRTVCTPQNRAWRRQTEVDVKNLREKGRGREPRAAEVTSDKAPMSEMRQTVPPRYSVHRGGSAIKQVLFVTRQIKG
jgi:hypothetical protein